MIKTNNLQSLRKPTASAILVAACFVLTSCKKEEELILLPVSGKVTVDGKALVLGSVGFNPDSSKGNQFKKTLSTQIQPDGTYKLMTSTEKGMKEGAPAGWYKVTVAPEPGHTPEQANLKAEPFHKKFENLKLTTLLIEVKEGAPADAYDLKLTKP
jgi:hypothetical protein